jgi:dihydroorotase
VRGGTVVDSTGLRRGDVLVEDGRIVAVGEGIAYPLGTTVLEASGCIVAPGLVDIHTHLREPGGEAAETVETGTRAAALGGYTAVVAMPNTDPATDSAAAVRYVQELARGACADVAVAGAITIGRAGREVVPLAEMTALGVRLFTDDGSGVQDGDVLRRALEAAGPLGVVLAEHCQDDTLTAGGLMHDGAWSRRFGIPGQPAAAEEAMLARDLALVRRTGAPMHFLHVSTAGSVELVRAAKAAGLPVTAEATPHHLVLTDASAASGDPLFKVAPPLRSASDGAAGGVPPGADRRHRDRSRPAHRGAQEGAVRRRPAGDDRAGDGPCPRLGRFRRRTGGGRPARPRRAVRHGVVAPCSTRRAGLGPRTRRPDRAGGPCPPLRL